MDLRAQIAVIKRHRWIILEAIILVALVAGFFAYNKTPVYKGTAKVLLLPDDPSERLTQEGQSQIDVEGYAEVQGELVRSPAVATEAARLLSHPGPEGLVNQVSVTPGEILEISATDVRPDRARDIANAFARAYIENRRQHAVGNLKRAADEVQKRLGDLQARLAEESRGPVPNPSRTATAIQFENLSARHQELTIDMSLKRGAAELVAEATLPAAPSGTPPWAMTLLGGIVGLGLGLGAAFLREQLDDRVRSTEEVERLTGFSILAEVPFERKLAKDGALAIDAPFDPVAEAARSLRTSVNFLSVNSATTRLLVSSTGPGEGKTTLAANLGVVYAQAGYRTVMVSADLRRPRLERIFPEGDGDGLTGLLAPRRQPIRRGLHSAALAPSDGVKSSLVRTRVPNLFILPCGPLPPNPAELLATRRMSDLLDEIAADADVIIIDSAPLMFSDSVALAGKVDGVLLVVAPGETHRRALQRVKASLDNVPSGWVGVVYNKVAGHVSRGTPTYYGRQKGRRPPKLDKEDKDELASAAQALASERATEREPSAAEPQHSGSSAISHDVVGHQRAAGRWWLPSRTRSHG